MQFLKADTAITLKIGPFLDETDGKTAETGLTIAQADVRLSKNGGNIAQKNESTSCTHDELGVYGCPIDATDTNTEGRLQLWVHESGALPVFHEYMVVNANVYDSLFAAATTDYLQVDALQLGGATQSATDLKDLADTGYDPSTHKVQGVVLSDTVTTLTGHTAQTGDNYARLGAPAGASVSADIAAIEAQTDDIGVAGAGLTAIPWNANWDAEVQSECADALTAYDPPTKAEMDTGHGLLATEAKQDIIDTNVDSILVDTGTTLDTIVDAILVDTGTTIPGLIAALNNVSTAEVNAEVVDALGTDTISELSQAAPTATPTIKTALMLLYMIARNKLTTTSTELGVYNDAGTKITKKALSDDGTTYTEGEMASGA